VDEVLKLVDLAAEEDRAEEDGGEQRGAQALEVVLLNRVYGEGHHQRRHQEDEGREGGQLN